MPVFRAYGNVVENREMAKSTEWNKTNCCSLMVGARVRKGGEIIDQHQEFRTFPRRTRKHELEHQLEYEPRESLKRDLRE